MEEPIKIAFPLTLLRPGPELLDPENTETTWEYYLLENLACGLVRDSQTSPTGYEGCLAENFFQEDPKTWVFILRNIKWSDGSYVSKNQILNWLNSLVNKNRRHIQFLKHAESITFDESTRIVRIKFSSEVDKTILHELSLADAGLFPENYKKNGWGKTIGPYFVELWDSVHNKLIFSKNKFSTIASTHAPNKAEFFKLLDASQRKNLFKSISVDIQPMIATSNPKTFAEVLPNAPQIFVGYPNAISYFLLNQACADTHNIHNRELFAEAINLFKKDINLLTKEMAGLYPEDQMIPNGFNGRIQNLILNKIDTNSLNQLKILVAIPTVFKEMNMFNDSLKATFRRLNISLDIEFTDEAADEKKYFAKLSSFLGNQLDATGSWAFLASPESGVLKNWYSLYATDYKRVYDLKEISRKDQNLKLLHERVLEAKIIVPLMVGSQRYLLSQRVNVDAWNKFDSRLRIYLINWQ